MDGSAGRAHCGRLLLAAVLAIAAAAPTPAAKAQAPAGDAAAGAAIRSLWSALDDHWNGRDAGRFSALFAERASMEFVDRGERLEGRAAIHRSFAERFPGFAPELRHRTRVRRIETVSADVQVADGRVEILRAAADDTAASAVLKTFAIFAVMRRSGEGWAIQALRVFELPGADGPPTPAPAAD